MRKLIHGLLCGAAMLTAGGCNGGGSPAANPANTPGTAEFKAVVSAARLARLAPAADGFAGISGQLGLSGITVVDGAGLPAAGSGFGSIFIRIVDPGDDILSLVTGQPDSTGRFNLLLPSPPLRSVLEVSFKTDADLDGDGTGGDTFRQRLPLALAPAKSVSADITLRQQAGFQPGVPQQGGGAAPTVITMTADTLDADGRHGYSRANDYSSGEVVADANADSQYDPLADLLITDTNGDGLDDASYPFYVSALPYATVFGVITRLDEFKREAELLVRSGETGYIVNVKLDPQASVELYLPKAPGGTSFAQLNPDQVLVGRSVYLDGFYTDGATQRAMTVLAVTVLQ